MARKPFKKDLTPIGRGGIDTHTGKGAREQRRDPAGEETLTGGDPEQRSANQYPKSAPEPEAEMPAEEPPAPPVPMGEQPARMPTAMMPGGGGDDGDEAA